MPSGYPMESTSAATAGCSCQAALGCSLRPKAIFLASPLIYDFATMTYAFCERPASGYRLLKDSLV